MYVWVRKGERERQRDGLERNFEGMSAVCNMVLGLYRPLLVGSLPAAVITGAKYVCMTGSSVSLTFALDALHLLPV